MAATFRVVLDACVMLPQHLNNLLLTLAEHDLFTPVWTPHLLDEVHRNLTGKLGVTAGQADHRITQMRRAFPHASDHSAGYLTLVDAMTNHPKDRHVLASAVASGAALIVTANLKDFPSQACDPHGITAVHPDDFLLDQLDLDPQRVMSAVTALVDRNQHPPHTPGQLAEALRSVTPTFAAAVVDIISPVPTLEIVDDAEVDKQFPDGIEETLRDPAAVARAWWFALLERDEYPYAVGNLSVSPEAWDFDDVAQALEGYSLATGVHEDTDRDDVVYLKFVPVTGHSMRVFGETAFTEYRVLALQQDADGYWHVYGLSTSWPPTAQHHRRPDSDERL
ncbi:PIN domain-containing protein [Gordonia terrae]|uniref:PIN domain-containing protein n=1 Tax=Gordonia terrae TaxID=2055 RepID=UPI003F6B2B69